MKRKQTNGPLAATKRSGSSASGYHHQPEQEVLLQRIFDHCDALGGNKGLYDEVEILQWVLTRVFETLTPTQVRQLSALMSEELFNPKTFGWYADGVRFLKTLYSNQDKQRERAQKSPR
jgi:hypothetical protein